jgi:hypothetical protein
VRELGLVDRVDLVRCGVDDFDAPFDAGPRLRRLLRRGEDARF